MSGDGDQDDYSYHYNTGEVPDFGASEPAHRGYQDQKQENDAAWTIFYSNVSKMADTPAFTPISTRRTDNPAPHNPAPVQRQIVQPRQQTRQPQQHTPARAESTFAYTQPSSAPVTYQLSTKDNIILNIEVAAYYALWGAATIVTTAVGGTAVLGVACLFSENARTIFSAGANVVVPAVITAIGYTLSTAVDVAAPTVYYTARYGYEAIATTINNVDLVAAGLVSGYVGFGASSLVIEEAGHSSFLDRPRGLLTCFALSALIATGSVYATATQARKLGYEIGLPQLTENGAAISAWGRASKHTSAIQRPDTLTIRQNYIPSQAYKLPVVLLPLPPHQTEQELRILVTRLRGGYQLTREQISELSSKGLYVRGSGQNTTIAVAPGYLPLPPQNTESAHQRWQRLNRKNTP